MLVQWLFGWVAWEVQNPAAGERFLNCCARARLSLWNLKPGEGGKGVSGRMRVRDYRHIRPLARKAGARLRAGKRRGLPFLWNRLRGRPGLLFGGAAFFALLCAFSQCFWTVEVTGCRAIPETALRAALAEFGVAPGAPKAAFSPNAVQAALMRRFPQLAWVTVNDRGSDADVRLLEKDAAPQVFDDEGFCSLRAAKSGTVVEMHIWAGTPTVKVGEGVLSGQLLVSSVVESESTGEWRMRHAAGQVIAETTQVLRADVPLQKEVAVPQGEPVKRRSLELFGARIPLSWRLAPDGAYTARGVRTSLSVYDRLLPAAVLEETLQPVSVITQPRTREEAEALAREELARQEAALGAGVEITAREDRVRVTDEAVTVERTLTCREDIAYTAPIGWETP